MDWTLAITRNAQALISVIAGLYAYAGLANGAAFDVLPRCVHRTLLRLVHTAEAAVRRVIILAAHDVVVNILPAAAKSATQWWVGLNSSAPTFRAFPLIDPLKRFAPYKDDAEDTFEFIDGDMRVDKDDAEECQSIPRITLPGLFDAVFAAPRVASLDDLMNAAQLSLRLAALQRALSSIPAHAKRLARWQAQRDFALKRKAPFKPVRVSPFRPGSPPGARLHRRHEVDHILRECHLLMLDRLADTS